MCECHFQPLLLTVGELGPADCFLHPLQFWQRLSASDMKEHRESSSNRSESSKENLSPSSHSANISSITSNVNLLQSPVDYNYRPWLGGKLRTVSLQERMETLKKTGGRGTTKTQLRAWGLQHSYLMQSLPKLESQVVIKKKKKKN